MISHTTERFRKMFADLTESIQRQAGLQTISI
jgi:hypothetical protein